MHRPNIRNIKIGADEIMKITGRISEKHVKHVILSINHEPDTILLFWRCLKNIGPEQTQPPEFDLLTSVNGGRTIPKWPNSELPSQIAA